MLRRLLLVTGGGGSFAPPAFPSGPFALTGDGSFGWGDLGSIQGGAVHYNGTTYWGYIKSNGNVAIRSWDHATETASAETDLGFVEADFGHAAPSLLVRDSDKRILIFYCSHNDTNLWMRVSTNPEDISAFGAATDLASQIGSGLFTYPAVMQLRDETSDPIYLFVRSDMNGTATWSYAVSTNGGATWGAMTDVWTVPSQRGYCLVSKTSDSRIDVIASDGAHGVEFDASLWHFYWSAGNWHESDGTTISSPPFDTSDATLVYDGSVGNEGVEGSGIGLDSGGAPVAVFRQWETWGPPGDQRYWWARWNGTSWDAQQLVASGATTGGGMVTLDPADPSRVWLVRTFGGESEIMYWTTDDDGATWDETALTTSSAEPNYLPIPVREADPSLRVLWGYGDWAGGTDWSTAEPMGWG